MKYLTRCWSSLTDSNGHPLVVIHAQNTISGATFFGSYATGGTLATGQFEIELNGYEGFSPDSDYWSSFFDYANGCLRISPGNTGQNVDCINDGWLETRFAKAAIGYPEFCRTGNSTATCQPAAADARWKNYDLITEPINQNGDWIALGPGPTDDVVAWNSGPLPFGLNTWTHSDMWEGFQWG